MLCVFEYTNDMIYEMWIVELRITELFFIPINDSHRWGVFVYYSIERRRAS